MDFSEHSQIVPLALRRTHRANAGAKRKQAEEESSKSKDKSKEMKKKKKRQSAPPSIAATSPKTVVKMAADFIRPSKMKVPVPKAIKNLHPHNDFYCWECHGQRRDGNFLYCNICPRAYHDTCAELSCPQPDWVCWECEKITDAECTETQSRAMASLTVDKLAKVLRTAIEKMKRYTNSVLFTPIDDLREFRDYRQFVFHPMDLSVIEKNVQDRSYGSTEAFLADAKWIVHNAYVYFGSGNKYSNAAKGFLKACETEMAEVELCPDCYLGAIYKRAQWFSEVCTKPHPLVWAKLHGFPFWPAKAMKEEDGLIEARFFGQHDRAMIPVHNCFQYSTQIPFPASKKRLTGLNAAIKEVEVHIKKLEEKLGTPYKFAPHLTPYDPNKRYTTSSLAVMPDGKVKSLTEAGRNAQMKSKIMENGKDESKKEKKEEEGDDIVDVTGTASEVKEKEDVKRDLSSEMNIESSDASSNKVDEGSTTSPSPDVHQSSDHVGMEHSYASKEECEEGKESKENMDSSQEKESEEGEQGSAGVEESCEEHSAINDDRKRKRSESPTQQPPKMSKMAVVEDDNREPNAEDPDSDDTQKQNALSPADASNNSADPQLPADSDKDNFSILPVRLPCLDDLEASVNSSESSSSIPEDDVKSNASTPRKDTFLLNLCKTIDTCKASLGIKKEEVEEEDEGGDEGERDGVDGLEDADTTGDEMIESEDDEDEGIEKETNSKDEDMDDGAKDGEHVGEVRNNENGNVDKSSGVSKQVIEDSEDSLDSPVLGGDDDQEAPMETEEDVQNDEMAKSQTSKRNAVGEKKDEEAVVEDKMSVNGTTENGIHASKATPMESVPANDEEEKVIDISDDDEVDGGGDYDGDSSSDGALLIDEGDDEPEDGTSNKANTADTGKKKTDEDAKAAPADADKKDKNSNEAEPETKENTTTGAEARNEGTNDKEGSGKEAEKSSGAGDEKPVDLSKTSKELLAGTPKTVEKDPDYQKLIDKVVEDAVKSFKELDESLTDASADLKNLVLNLKREVISLKAKQELQQKELLHINKLAAAEVRQVMEYSRDTKLSVIKRIYDKQKGDAVFATKGKQWCASCSQEAHYFCCWNTSYCSYGCQERHWSKHEKRCQQKSGNFPFIPGPDFDPYRKKKKKKRKREEEQAWLKEYGLPGEEESDDDDPTWKPDPEDLPTMVLKKKTYSPMPGQIPQKQKPPKAWNPPNQRPPTKFIPNQTWTQPSGRLNSQLGNKTTLTTPLIQARQRLQTQLLNAAYAQNLPASSKPVYIPAQTMQQNRMPVGSQNAAGNSTVFINAPQNPVKYVTYPKNEMPNQSNVVYVGATQAGIQPGVPTNLTMQTAVSGVSGGIQPQGSSNIQPIRLQIGNSLANKIGVSSLVQALGQPLQQGGKYVIQLAPGQQVSNMQNIQAVNMVGGLPQGTGAVAPAGNVVQQIRPAGMKAIPRVGPGVPPTKHLVINMPISVPGATTNTASPVDVTNTPIAENAALPETVPVAAVVTPSGSTE